MADFENEESDKINETISDENYFTMKSGDDIIITIGDGSIILKGAANLSEINIPPNEIVTGGEGTDVICCYRDGYSGITGGAGEDLIYSCGDGDDVIYNCENFSIDEGNAYIRKNNWRQNDNLNPKRQFPLQRRKQFHGRRRRR